MDDDPADSSKLNEVAGNGLLDRRWFLKFGTAALAQPVLAYCFTRFRIPWRWSGAPAILKSRVIDETGYRQPERDVLLAERGRHGYFHYNAIVSWAVTSEGAVRHAYA